MFVYAGKVTDALISLVLAFGGGCTVAEAKGVPCLRSLAVVFTDAPECFMTVLEILCWRSATMFHNYNLLPAPPISNMGIRHLQWGKVLQKHGIVGKSNITVLLSRICVYG